ncbi:MAG: hypothetical protein KC635_05465 [Myxococcales bacterium]|nr:hypothetical protein [Myxococcales bacterium]MCB9733909.1 hypothetical protein [Deltaproteobacteria bacterium]
MRRALLIAAAVLGLADPARAATPAPAVADDPGPDAFPHAPGWFLPVGIELGGSTAIDGRDGRGGFLVGAELTLGYLFGTAWAGAFTDARWVTGAGVGRVAAGLEAGWFVFGAELAYTAELGGAEPVHGVRFGAVVTLGLAGVAARWCHGVAGAGAGDDVEVVLLLKWPLPLE